MLGLLLSLAAFAGTMTVDVLDVGQGDSLLVTSPAGKRVLIDAGTGKHDVAPMLERRGVEKLDLIIATHPHADHIGGMDEVLDAFEVGVYTDNGMPHTTSAYAQVMERVRTRASPTAPPSPARSTTSTTASRWRSSTRKRRCCATHAPT